jgi:hypothetical protein
MKGFALVSNNGENADPDLHEFDLDDPLLDPPDAIAEPAIDPLTEYLDFDRLTWENFERLLVRVAQDVRGLRNVRRFGTRGQSQKGLDVIGINSANKAEGIQSKRRKTFTKRDLDDAVKNTPKPTSHSRSPDLRLEQASRSPNAKSLST